MTLSVLAAVAVCQIATATPCDRPADCGAGGVCVAGECRAGSARAAVEHLATIAVPAPLLVHGDADLEARAAKLAGHVAAALQWTGFYAVAPPERHPRVPSSDRLTDAARAVWGSFGVDRVLRLTVERTMDPGTIAVRVDVADTARRRLVQLSEGRELVPVAADRRSVARWVNALVGHDTGLPGCVGTRLLVSAGVARGNKEIAVIDSDGANLTFITGNGDLNLHPAWGPAGSVGYMSYVRRNPDWVVDGAPFSTRPGLNAAGAWSPDGQTLALSVTDDESSDIVLLDAVTGEERGRLTSDPAVDTSPSWSPDGRRIAFVSDRTGSPQIWLHDLDEERSQRLTQGGYMASPAWSPLGDTLVYTQLVAGEAILIRHDLDTGRIERLTQPGASAESPTLSPDGRYVVFVRKTAEHPAALWRLPVRGGASTLLAHHAWPLYAPDWQP